MHAGSNQTASQARIDHGARPAKEVYFHFLM
jgi:hypothetical protein